MLRGTPILLQLYFFWIGLPKLVPFELSDTQCIVVALAVNASAFISEIIRAGIAAVDKGQWEAARMHGFPKRHVMTHVILPQAVKNILPALCNEFISTVKGHVARVRLLRRRADDELQNRAECDVPRAGVADDRRRDLLYSQLCTLQTSEDFGTEAVVK